MEANSLYSKLRGDYMKIDLNEEITIYTINDIYEKFVYVLKDPYEELIINLSNLEEIDGAGLQLLISLQKTCDASNRKCHFIFSKSIENNLKLYGVDNVLDMEVH